MEQKTTKIIAIETSCDDTGVALVEFARKQEPRILFNLTSSQTKIHAKFGGVVPTLAAREHQKNLPILLEKMFKKTRKIPDFLAVTRGPGLIPSLLVGIAAAKTLGYVFKKPVFAVNHLRGHLAMSLNQTAQDDALSFQKTKGLQNIFPAIALLVSGGHTEILRIEDWQKIELIGETRDDAAGEAFDKTAKLLGLGYPGGPVVSKLAKKGTAGKYPLPRPMIRQKNYDFSFSGLKTAVFYLVRELTEKNKKISNQKKADLCRAFEEAVIETLVSKTKKAVKNFQPKTLILGGGVAANQNLRASLKNLAAERQIRFLVPETALCADNALMIALAARLDQLHGVKPQNWDKLEADANLKI